MSQLVDNKNLVIKSVTVSSITKALIVLSMSVIMLIGPVSAAAGHSGGMSGMSGMSGGGMGGNGMGGNTNSYYNYPSYYQNTGRTQSALYPGYSNYYNYPGYSNYYPASYSNAYYPVTGSVSPYYSNYYNQPYLTTGNPYNWGNTSYVNEKEYTVEESRTVYVPGGEVTKSVSETTGTSALPQYYNSSVLNNPYYYNYNTPYNNYYNSYYPGTNLAGNGWYWY